MEFPNTVFELDENSVETSEFSLHSHNNNRAALLIILTKQAKEEFARETGHNIGKKVRILINNEPGPYFKFRETITSGQVVLPDIDSDLAKEFVRRTDR